MSRESISILAITVVATAAVLGERFITVAGATPAAGARCLGVCKADASIDEAVAVDVLGTALVVAGAAVTKGDQLEVGVAGKAITQSAGAVVAVALADATADGDVIEVLLMAN